MYDIKRNEKLDEFHQISQIKIVLQNLYKRDVG